MKVILFGQLKDLVPGGSLEIPAVGNSKQLRQWLESRFPVLSELPYLLAIDRKIVEDTIAIAAHQEIAILPPYSGG